jgi:hypothetical protein
MSASMVGMGADANPPDDADGADDDADTPDRIDPGPDDPGDAAALAGYAQTLATAMAAAIPAWIERVVIERIQAERAAATPAERAAATEAGRQAGAEAGPELAILLSTDIDRQRTTPLAVARRQVRWATAALESAGISPATRDPFAQRQAPDDLYDLTPASFADIDPTLAEPGLVWGAAKAHVHLARRRRAGDR